MVFAIEQMVAQDFEAIENHVRIDDGKVRLCRAGTIGCTFQFLLLLGVLVGHRVIVVGDVHLIGFLMEMVIVGRGGLRCAVRVGERRGGCRVGRRAGQIVRHGQVFCFTQRMFLIESVVFLCSRAFGVGLRGFRFLHTETYCHTGREEDHRLSRHWTRTIRRAARGRRETQPTSLLFAAKINDAIRSRAR